jgi:hypothetical protein
LALERAFVRAQAATDLAPVVPARRVDEARATGPPAAGADGA